MANHVSIIILNQSSAVSTIRCLNSLKLLLEGETTFDTILVDNASTDGSVKQILLNYPELNIISLDQAVNFASGINAGLREAQSTKSTHYLVLSHKAQIIDGSMLDRLINIDKDLAAPFIKYQKDRRSYVNYGRTINKYFGHPSLLEYPLLEPSPNLEAASYLSSKCLLIKRTVIERLGLLDEEYQTDFSEADYCFRATKLGFTLGLCDQTEVYLSEPESSKINPADQRRFILSHLSPLYRPIAMISSFFRSPKL